MQKFMLAYNSFVLRSDRRRIGPESKDAIGIAVTA